MTKITFTIQEEGRDWWVKKYDVELDTENYTDIDEMRQAAYEAVQDGDIEPYDADTTDSEVDNTEIVDDSYDDDETDYTWGDGTVAPLAAGTEPEETIEW
jgi:glycine betaine/choline ABC-type transport system substrate-binding protein